MSFEIRRKIALSLPTFIVEPTLQATLVQTCSTTLRSMRSLTTPTSTTVHSERISKCCPKIHYGRCKLWNPTKKDEQALHLYLYSIANFVDSWLKSRRCFRMEGALHTDLWKSETNRDIKKKVLIPFKHLQNLYWFSKSGGRGSKIKPATPI